MAAKTRFLVVACLVFTALAADPRAGLVAAKDVAQALQEALQDEKPLLKEEEQKAASFRHTSAVQSHLPEVDEMKMVENGEYASEFERDVTALVLGLSKGGFGATPFGDSVKKISAIIEKEMMPAVLNAHSADQKALDALAEDLKACGSTRDKELALANIKKTQYTSWSKNHKTCRGKEAALYSENVACHAEWKAAKKQKELKCKAFAEKSRLYGDSFRMTNIVKKSGSEDTETYVRRIHNTVCPKDKNGGGGSGGGRGMLEDYLVHKIRCKEATQKFNIKTKECKLLDQKWHDRRKSCNTMQDNMDGASCKWAIDTKDACEAYEECYHAVKKSYDDKKCSEWEKPNKQGNCTKGVEADERQRWPEWKGLKRMHCIIAAFGGGGGITMKDILRCKAVNHTTDHLNIKYPLLPNLEVCKVPLLYPNTAEYKKAEFTPLPTLAKGKVDANECTGVSEISTTPASGSPAKCKCERITMNGPYSPGAVVRCTDCLDVSKSNDKISCPIGTKLFSPQSRQDWESFLKSVKPSRVRAPHWIIDITRPQNGCGGCTSHFMNTQVTQQKSWVTRDASPWWLRSTKYNEPNGDYQANCFLDLWHTPKNADSVTWNDGNCNYHSKSYYCQAMKFSTAPKSGSPKGCTCKKVELNGKYSARFLFKCSNCLDVRRSKDKNSCPMGTKLFSPETREDWKTFIASATQLRSPHWIIDITRPTNGCGGCTRNPMNSANAAQGTWHTADGSPWWLRSSRYSEPNGDYHANCYLDLWHNPPNENSVTWNDGNCNYHSKSYYCQTVKAKKVDSKHTSTLPPWKVKEQWKLVLKTNGDATFGFSSAYWTNDNTLNPTADAQAAGNAKYPEFTNVPFSRIKMCVGTHATGCVEHKFTRDYTSAKALFAAGYIKDKTLDQKGILKAFGPAKGAYQECPAQRPGFNIECNDGNKARWGYCTNCQSQPCQNSDSNDADAAIGIGLAGQSTPKQMGAGWTNYFASGKGTCNANSMTAKNVWFYVFQNLML